jgi:hypothetical protein
MNTPTEEFLARRAELGRATRAAALTTEEINGAPEARTDLPRTLLPNERGTLLALLRENIGGIIVFVSPLPPLERLELGRF